MMSTTRLHQVVHLCEALLQPGGFKAFTSWKPFSITSFRILRELAQDGLEFHTIIDGGANKGQFARAAAETYPEADVVAFEPLPDVALQLKNNLADRKKVKIIQSAIGNRDGTIEFFRHGYSLSSSVLRPLQSRGATGIKTLKVPICRLDDALRQFQLRPPILLKLDLQGYEIEALKGASDVLTQVSHVLVETSFVPSYEGEAVFGKMLDYMNEAGFGFVRPVDFLRNERGSIVQMDALFARHSAESGRS